MGGGGRGEGNAFGICYCAEDATSAKHLEILVA